MRSMRTRLSFLTALAFAAFSLPSGAASTQKQFTIDMGSLQTTSTATTLNATIWNLSSGNSTIKSLTITAPAGFTIAGAAPLAPITGTIGTSCNNQFPCATVTLNFMSGLNTSGSGPVSGTMALTVNIPSGQTCSQYQWTAAAYAGNSFSQPFTYLGPDQTMHAQPYTTFTTGCALKFSPSPSNTQTNTAIPVGVELVDSSNNQVQTWFMGPVTLTQTAGPSAALSITGPTYSSGVANFSVTGKALGSYTVQAASGTLTPINGAFTIYDGMLNCNPNPPFRFTDNNTNHVSDPSQSGYAAGSRGFWNKDGLACVPILYTFTNTILTDNTVHLAWDTSTQQLPAFTYTMTWKTEDVANPNNPTGNQDSSTYGWPVPKRPYVAWQASDGTVSTANFVPALTCMSPDLPAPYATLAADVGTADSQVSITVSTPQSVPSGYPTATLPTTASTSSSFPIVIGTERMKVIGVTAGPTSGQYTLTVVRGDDGLRSPAPHIAGVYVMSTPLPIDTDPSSSYYQKQVPMCVVEHGWTAAGIDPSNGIAQIRYWTTVFDIGDGFVTIR